MDEAHRIKNEKSKLSMVVREFKSNNRYVVGWEGDCPTSPDFELY